MKKYIGIIIILCVFAFPLYPGENTSRFASLENTVEELSFTNRAKSFDFIEEMYAIAQESNDSLSLIARTLYSETLLSERQGIKNPNLIVEVNRLLAKKDELSPRDVITLQSALKQIRLAEGGYAEVFTLSLDILEQATQLNDSLWVARTYNTLGNIARLVDLLNLAEEYYLEALKWVHPGLNDLIEFNIRSNLIYIYLLNSEDDTRIKTLEEADSFIRELEEHGKKGLLLINYLNVSNFWRRADNFDKTIDYLLKAQRLCEDNPYYESFILNNIGYYYRTLGEYDKAMQSLRKAQSTLEKYPHLSFVSSVYSNIAGVYEQTGEPDSALIYIHKRDSVTGNNDSHKYVMDILRKYMVTSLEVSENKLALAETKINLKSKQFIITLLLSVSLVLIALFIIIIFIQKRKSLRQQVKLKEAEAGELSVRLEKEQEQLEHKLRELTSYSLLLSNKNNVLQEINNVVRRLPPEEKEIRQKIEKIVKQNIEAENSWSDFMLHFDKVHPRFFERIQDNIPDITQNELKLVAYIRMGLSTKQIAQMSNVAPQSVKMSRHRLRQKLELDTEQNLDSYIQNI